MSWAYWAPKSTTRTAPGVCWPGCTEPPSAGVWPAQSF